MDIVNKPVELVWIYRSPFHRPTPMFDTVPSSRESDHDIFESEDVRVALRSPMNGVR